MMRHKTDLSDLCVAELLEAWPHGGCIFCGYNGENYYQAATHHLKCPWFSVAGSSNRAVAFASIVTALWERMRDAENDLRALRDGGDDAA